MLSFLLLSLMTPSSYSYGCGDLSQKIIRTYVCSDITNTYLSTDGLYLNVFEVSCDSSLTCAKWAYLKGSTPIFSTNIFSGSQTAIVTKNFTVLGTVLSANLSVGFDDSLTSFEINGVNVASYDYLIFNPLAVVNVTNRVRTGANSLRAVVVNGGGFGALLYRIDIDSMVYA